ncbi:hypothetical protein Tco_0030998 [Tanacetum coccineum]
MVAFLEKSTGSEGFHQVINFLNRSHICYALTKKPDVYISFIKQFWRSAEATNDDNGEVQITANIDGQSKTITKASLRRHLKLDDHDGITSIPNSEIFEQLALMGYHTDSDNPKKTAWEQFSSNIATAVICLATNRRYNFSRLIFEHMVSNISSPHKFLMYPRFIQICLDMQRKQLQQHSRTYPVPSLSIKVFNNMKRPTKGYSGQEVALFPTMLNVSEPSTSPSRITSSPSHSPEPSIEHSPDHTTAAVSFPSPTQPTQPSPGAEQHIPTPNESPLHAVHSHGSDEGSLKLIELTNLVTKLSERIGVLEDDLKKTKLTYSAAVTKLILRVKKLETKLKAGTARKRARVVLSEDDEDVEDDSSKQGRKLSDAEVQEKASTETEPIIQEVTPTEVIQDQGSSEKGNSEVSTAGATKGTASEVPVVSTAEVNISTAGRTVTYRRRSEEKRTRKDKGKAIMTEPEPKKKSKKELEQERLSFAEAIRSQELNGMKDWNDPSVIRYHALKMKPKTVVQARRNMVWDFNQHIEPMDLEHGSERMKSPEKIEEEDVDTQKEMKEVSKESGAKRKKSLPRKSTRIPREDVAEDVESLSTKYPIVDWKTYTLSENFMYYKIIRGDGSSKNYKILSEMLYDFDRQDIMELYRLVKERYSSSKPEGYDLMLWGDLHTLFEPDEESEIWMNQNEYNLIKKKYPLSQEMLSKMLSKRLEVDHESTQAYELLKFIRSQVQNTNGVSTASTNLVLSVLVNTARRKVNTADESINKIEKQVRKNNDAPIIVDWVSDDEDEVESHVVKTDIPTAAKIEKPVRKPVRYAEMYRSQRPRGNQRNWNASPNQQRKGKSVNTGRPFSTASNSQLNDKGFIDSGRSRHMTGNIAHLSDFKYFDEGYVTFCGLSYGGRITGKGTIKTDNLDFDDVYFVKELKFNLFSVSQMCDKKNYVLFTDSECLVLSPNFKLPDENQILLKIPRQDNMYSFDMKNILKGRNRKLIEAARTMFDDSKLLPHFGSSSSTVVYKEFLEYNDGLHDGMLLQKSLIDDSSLKENRIGRLGHAMKNTQVEDQELNWGNIPQFMQSTTTPHIRIHKDHPLETCDGDVKTMEEELYSSTAKEKPLVQDGDAADVDEHLYRSMIGSLMYLTTSRPDIMFAAEYVAAASCCCCGQFSLDTKAQLAGLWVLTHHNNGHQFTMSYRHQESASPKQMAIGLFDLLDMQKKQLKTHSITYPVPSLNTKVFSNMRRLTKGYTGVEIGLFPTMLTLPTPASSPTPSSSPSMITSSPSISSEPSTEPTFEPQPSPDAEHHVPTPNE